MAMPEKNENFISSCRTKLKFQRGKMNKRLLNSSTCMRSILNQIKHRKLGWDSGNGFAVPQFTVNGKP